jgi:hypothetical protein
MISQDRARALADAVAKVQDTLDTMHRALSVHSKAVKTLLEEIEQETRRADEDRIDSEARVIAILDHARKLAAEANAPKTEWDRRWKEVRAEKHARLFDGSIRVVGPHGTSIPVSSPAFKKWLDEHPHAAIPADDETPAQPSDDASVATCFAVIAATPAPQAVSFDLEVLAGHQLHAWITANPGRFGYTSITSDEYISFSPEVRALLTERGILVEAPVMSNGRPTAVGSGRWRLNLAGAHAYLQETSGAASPKPEDDR